MVTSFQYNYNFLFVAINSFMYDIIRCSVSSVKCAMKIIYAQLYMNILMDHLYSDNLVYFRFVCTYAVL